MSPSVPASAARTDCRHARPLPPLLLLLLPQMLLLRLLQLLLPASGIRGGSAGNLHRGASRDAADQCQEDLSRVLGGSQQRRYIMAIQLMCVQH
jgi:hypothetical protein